MRRYLSFFSLTLVAILSLGRAMAQDIASFEKRTTVKVLKNGLTVVLCERPEAPVFSFFTIVDAGAVQDPQGMSGMAHMFEHEAFKGTDRIGTTDYAKEKVALEKVEQAWTAYDREDRRENGRDPKRVAALKSAFDKAVADANSYVIKNRFGEIIEREGGVGLNATTNLDSTQYFYSLPVNRFEIWAYLESSRFHSGVLREFYKERDVVHEERRLRTDSSPVGKMVEQFLAAAYTAHPYGRSVVGWPSELDHLSATEAAKFYRKYYVPSNMVIALVGALKPEQVFPIVEKYFGPIPTSPKPEPLTTIEPEQFAERTVTIHDKSQPFYIEGYHRPGYQDPDDAVYDVISDLVSQGRTSRLYRSLVRDQKIAATAGGIPGFPGNKYPGLFAFFGVPLPGHTALEMGQAIHEQINRLKTEDVSDEELQMVKTRAKANLIRGLANNQGLAIQLATAQLRYGDWRELFRDVDKIDKVTKADIRRVANKTFVDSNRTVAVIETTQAQAAAGAPAQKETH
ncbi:MAG TPA: pitrilysin family protein [Candidatus Angelobacter sp.]|nr:pitrilysin family protein [Candidatus Angelobacter sp.]